MYERNFLFIVNHNPYQPFVPCLILYSWKSKTVYTHTLEVKDVWTEYVLVYSTTVLEGHVLHLRVDQNRINIVAQQSLLLSFCLRLDAVIPISLRQSPFNSSNQWDYYYPSIHPSVYLVVHLLSTNHLSTIHLYTTYLLFIYYPLSSIHSFIYYLLIYLLIHYLNMYLPSISPSIHLSLSLSTIYLLSVYYPLYLSTISIYYIYLLYLPIYYIYLFM